MALLTLPSSSWDFCTQESTAIELLELQSVLLEHVLGTVIALKDPAIVANPAQSMERCEGHVDKLRRSPSFPGGLSHLTGSSGELAPLPPGGATGVALAHGQRKKPPPLPPTVAVVSTDPITRRIVSAAITASSTSTEVLPFETLEEATSAAAGPEEAPVDSRVVVFCCSPDTPFRSVADLPRSLQSGKLRGFVIVGEVPRDSAEAIYSSDSGWCELVRLG